MKTDIKIMNTVLLLVVFNIFLRHDLSLFKKTNPKNQNGIENITWSYYCYIKSYHSQNSSYKALFFLILSMTHYG